MKKTLFAFSVLGALLAQAEVLDRPAGFKIGQHMTIRPYVSLYYTWDSNVDSSTEQGSYSSFNVNPGFTFAYKQENWSVEGGAYYQYHAYTENSSNLDESSWGENLAFTWTNSKDGGRGWALVLRENVQMISQDDDMMNDGGRGIGRDRMQIQTAATLQRRFTERWHGDINATYYMIDYDNDQTSYAPLYGWTRWTAGTQLGYAASRWTDFILSGNFQGYTQENDSTFGVNPGGLSADSQGWTIHAGIGSYATERITYRVTGGYSQFRYSDGDYTTDGFTYTATAHWRMSDNWNMMLLASSYFQPDETQYGSLERIDTASWGVAHSMVRNKLTATLDLAYRHENRDCEVYEGNDLNEDIITARIGFNYALNRFLSLFTHCEYQRSCSDGSARVDAYGYEHNWDYDRWRLSAGLRLTY